VAQKQFTYKGVRYVELKLGDTIRASHYLRTRTGKPELVGEDGCILEAYDWQEHVPIYRRLKGEPLKGWTDHGLK
jgi:hypothetical protein